MQKKCIFVLPSKSKKYFIMEQRNNKQDLIIFEIENLLNKMSNQVNFLIRKEMTMNQLDVDLLMENTRKLYDTICSIELGVRSEELGVRSVELGVNDEEDADTDADSELIDPSTDRLGLPLGNPRYLYMHRLRLEKRRLMKSKRVMPLRVTSYY